MSQAEAARVRLAVLRAGGRPGPWVAGLALAWIASGAGGILAVTLAACTGYLSWLVGVLLVAPPVEASRLEAPTTPLLPSGKVPSKGAPLSAPLRARFQSLHESVQGMVEAWPTGNVMPVDKSRLGRIPEAFREMARLSQRMKSGDPGKEPLEARMIEVEAQVERLRLSWSLLASDGTKADQALEDLATTTDQLEALLEVG